MAKKNWKIYRYIILAIIFGLFNKSLSGINYYEAFEALRLIPTDDQEKYSNHGLIRQIFYYFGASILSIIFLYYERKRNRRKSSKHKESNGGTNKPAGTNGKLKTGLIKYKIPNVSKISVLFLLFIIIIWVLIEQIIEKYNCTLTHLDFWMIELIIISYLNARIMKQQIYKHHKLAIIVNLFPMVCKILTIYLSFKSNNNNDNNNKYLDKNDNIKLLYLVFWYVIPLGIFIYILLITLRSYTYVKIKWLMDLKYISVYRLLFLYGFIGAILYTLICTLTTFLKCKKEDGNINIYDYICLISFDGKKYFENFKDYFKTSKDIKEIIFEIIVIILGIISFYFYKYYSMMIIKLFSPVHLIFLSPIYFLFFKIVLILYNAFLKIIKKGGKFFDDTYMKYIKKKFILDIFGDGISFIGFLIYFEIIKLKLCKLNYDLRENIIERGEDETIEVYDNECLTDSLDEEN